MQTKNIDVIDQSYLSKPTAYFEGTRVDLIEHLPIAPDAMILEIGCGSGSTGAFALASNKCGRYFGVEIQSSAAKLASEVLSEVLVGNIETMTLPYAESTFDVIIISEVLEHLIDPWEAVAKLIRYLKPLGRIIATTPNISHWRVIRSLFAGRFDYNEMGVMDRTHLRWFTPATFRDMFIGAGFSVDSVGSSGAPGRAANAVNLVTRGKFSHLFCTQMTLFGHRSS